MNCTIKVATGMRGRIVGPEIFKMLNEFESKGFVSYSNEHGHFLSVLRTRYGDYYRIFKSSHRGKKRRDYFRFGPFEIFGKRLYYYYDIRRKEEFVDFLVKMFYEKNPQPDKNIKGVFTRLLNYHGLSWIEKNKIENMEDNTNLDNVTDAIR